MAIRKIIQIDEELCDGCGDCVKACHEGAIQLINGKAKLVSDVYCDGLGDCVGECHVGAIKIIEREAADYDDDAVQRRLTDIGRQPSGTPLPQFGHHVGGGCPGSAMRNLTPQAQTRPVSRGMQATQPPLLGHWPVQLMLVPPHAPFLKGADLLVCADCVPFAVPDFHYRYLSGRAVVVGCPKLDDLGHYYQKLEEMFRVAQPNSITVLRMEVPCCGGIAQAAIQAARNVIPETPLEIHTVGISGGIQVDTVVSDRANQAG